MSDHRPPEGHPVLRGLGLWAVAAGVVVLAAAAFVLSYPGIHAVALHAGVSRPLARIYPVIFDAMLVIACAAVLSLRGAGLLSRCYAWLSLLVLLAAAAGADTLHSTDVKLPHRAAAATAAIIPWALLLIGFGLLLAMLRHARLRRAAAAARDAERPPPPRPAPVMAALPVGHAVPADPPEAPKQGSPLELPPAANAEPGDPDPEHAEAEQSEAGEVILAAPLVPQPRAEEPPFHRMWSTPTPPDEDYEG
jgi:Protein of unknown function (DUF2637)